MVWNPWDSKAKEMEDFGDDEVYPEIFYNCHTFLLQFPNMICVNAGQVSTPVTLLAGQAFEASLILQVM